MNDRVISRRFCGRTSLALRAGELLVSDGPFAETKEQIAGYDVAECSSLDQAIEVAAGHPGIRSPGSARSRSGRSTAPAGGGPRIAAGRAATPST